MTGIALRGPCPIYTNSRPFGDQNLDTKDLPLCASISVPIPEIEAGKRWVVVQALNKHPPALIRQAVQPEVQANEGGIAPKSPPDVPSSLRMDLYEV